MAASAAHPSPAGPFGAPVGSMEVAAAAVMRAEHSRVAGRGGSLQQTVSHVPAVSSSRLLLLGNQFICFAHHSATNTTLPEKEDPSCWGSSASDPVRIAESPRGAAR
jgi:hypothetical protein